MAAGYGASWRSFRGWQEDAQPLSHRHVAGIAKPRCPAWIGAARSPSDCPSCQAAGMVLMGCAEHGLEPAPWRVARAHLASSSASSSDSSPWNVRPMAPVSGRCGTAAQVVGGGRTRGTRPSPRQYDENGSLDSRILRPPCAMSRSASSAPAVTGAAGRPGLAKSKTLVPWTDPPAASLGSAGLMRPARAPAPAFRPVPSAGRRFARRGTGTRPAAAPRRVRRRR